MERGSPVTLFTMQENFPSLNYVTKSIFQIMQIVHYVFHFLQKACSQSVPLVGGKNNNSLTGFPFSAIHPPFTFTVYISSYKNVPWT